MISNLVLPDIPEPDIDFNARWLFRAATDQDLHFVANSWSKSFRRSNLTRCMDSKLYYHQHAAVIEKLLQTSFVYIAHGVTQKDLIFGYIVGEEIAETVQIHYIYVRKDIRKMNLATELLNYVLKGKPWVATSITDDGYSFTMRRNGVIDTLTLLRR
jgi:ribosomal protein S18 acetylase RimI-like enzyme